MKKISQLLVLLPAALASAAAAASMMPCVDATNVNPDHDDGDSAPVDILQIQWKKHRQWEKVHKKRRETIRFARLSKLVLVTFGAVAQVAATQVVSEPHRKAATFVGGVCVGIGAKIKSSFLTDEKVKSMTTSFYTSQALNSEVCKFLAKADPYYEATEDEALEQLQKECTRLSEMGGEDISFYSEEPDSKEMPQSMDTKKKYLKYRVNCMKDGLYKKKGPRIAKIAKRFSLAEDVLLYAGTLTGIGVTQREKLPAGIQKVLKFSTGYAGCFTTVSAGLANHISKVQYEQLSRQYIHAGKKLDKLMEYWRDEIKEAGSPGWNEQIIKCEDVILSTAKEIARIKRQ